MRKLTIKRTKSFVGSLVKLKVYIEDATSNDIVINKVSCRKLGVLKNNEEKTFEIGEDQAKVFVIADKISKDYCNDFYQLPAGQEDVFLSGKNKFNPANGNAFIFDNNDNEEAQKNRKKGSKIGLIVLIAAVLVGAVAGYVATSAILDEPNVENVEAETFSDNGMSITLTNEFEQIEVENYTNCYESADVAIFALKESFSLADGFENYTLKQYGELVLQSNNMPSSKLKTKDGLTCFEFEYEHSDTNDTYNYFSFVYKSDDAFWLVQFATLEEDVDNYESKIIEWAKSVSFE